MINKLSLVFTSITPSGVLLLLATLIAPIAPIMYGVLFLIFADTITGVIAHYYRNNLEFKFFKWSSWKHITSNRMGDYITKTLVYMMLILSGAAIDLLIIPNESLYFTKALAGAVSLREIKSLIENGEAIVGGGLLSSIREFLKGGFKHGVNEIFKDKKDINGQDEVQD